MSIIENGLIYFLNRDLQSVAPKFEQCFTISSFSYAFSCNIHITFPQSKYVANNMLFFFIFAFFFNFQLIVPLRKILSELNSFSFI